MDHDDALVGIYKGWIDAGLELQVTILVGGSWVAGTAISGRAYFEQLAAMAGTAGVLLKDLGRVLYPADSELDAGLDIPYPDHDFTAIHLRDARMWVGGQFVPVAGCLLRVRASAIDGWVYGILGPPGYASPPPPL